jgi:hypothetical protein
MFMRVPVEELARSQICFRFNEADGSLTYEVRPLSAGVLAGEPPASSTGDASSSTPSINFQTIYDDHGRRQGLSVFASLPQKFHVPSPPSSEYLPLSIL